MAALILAFPPVGSASTSSQVWHRTRVLLWLNSICSLSQLMHRTRRNRDVGRGMRCSHSAKLYYLQLLEPNPFTL